MKLGGVDGARTRDPRRDRPGVEQASMRVSARFIFQNTRKTRRSCPGRSIRIPTRGTRTASTSPITRRAAKSPNHGVAEHAVDPVTETQNRQGRTPRVSRACSDPRTRRPLRLLRTYNFDRRAARRRRRCPITEEFVPRRCRHIEVDAIAVARLNRIGTEVEPRPGANALAMRFREKRTAGPHALVDRIAMQAIPLSNIGDVVLRILYGVVSLQDRVHALSACALAGFISWVHFNSSFIARTWISGPRRSQMKSLQSTLGSGDVHFHSTRLGVRSFSLPADSRILSNPAVNAMPRPTTHSTDDRFAKRDESNLLLSRQEIIDLTGTQQPSRQRRWLDARGWPYVDALGKGAHPRVARAVFDEKMKGRDPSKAAPQPRFDALDQLARVS